MLEKQIDPHEQEGRCVPLPIPDAPPKRAMPCCCSAGSGNLRQPKDVSPVPSRWAFDTHHSMMSESADGTVIAPATPVRARKMNWGTLVWKRPDPREKRPEPKQPAMNVHSEVDKVSEGSRAGGGWIGERMKTHWTSRHQRYDQR